MLYETIEPYLIWSVAILDVLIYLLVVALWYTKFRSFALKIRSITWLFVLSALMVIQWYLLAEYPTTRKVILVVLSLFLLHVFVEIILWLTKKKKYPFQKYDVLAIIYLVLVFLADISFLSDGLAHSIYRYRADKRLRDPDRRINVHVTVKHEDGTPIRAKGGPYASDFYSCYQSTWLPSDNTHQDIISIADILLGTEFERGILEVKQIIAFEETESGHLITDHDMSLQDTILNDPWLLKQFKKGWYHYGRYEVTLFVTTTSKMVQSVFLKFHFEDVDNDRGSGEFKVSAMPYDLLGEKMKIAFNSYARAIGIQIDRETIITFKTMTTMFNEDDFTNIEVEVHEKLAYQTVKRGVIMPLLQANSDKLREFYGVIHSAQNGLPMKVEYKISKKAEGLPAP